jgi:hypothetical protein
MSVIVCGAKPWVEIDTVYGPPTRRPVTVNWPLLDVVAVEPEPVRLSTMRTLAPAAGAPPASTTVPRIADVVSCANPATDIESNARVAKSALPKVRNGKRMDFLF